GRDPARPARRGGGCRGSRRGLRKGGGRNAAGLLRRGRRFAERWTGAGAGGAGGLEALGGGAPPNNFGACARVWVCGDMPTRPTRNVSLTPELEEFVTAGVRSGRYQSTSEVVREGLRLLQDRDGAVEEVRGRIAVGLEQAHRGELLDGAQVFDELDRQG